MGINPISFNFQPLDLGPKFGDIAKGAVGAFNAQQQRGEERERALADNAMARLKLERAPEQMDADLLYSKNQAALAGANFEGKNLENNVFSKTGMEQALADIAQKKAIANKTGQDARSLEYTNNILQKRLEQRQDLNLPDNAVDLTIMAAGPEGRDAANIYRRQQKDDLTRAKAGKEALQITADMEKIVDRNPNLWKAGEYILENADPSGSNSDQILSYIKRNFGYNEKDLSDVQTFLKLSNTLALKLSAGQPGKPTDALRQMVVNAKANPGYTPATNKAIFEQTRREFAGYPELYNEVSKGISHGYYIPFVPEQYAGQQSAQQMPSQEMVTIRNPKTGETKKISREEAQKMGVRGL